MCTKLCFYIHVYICEFRNRIFMSPSTYFEWPLFKIHFGKKNKCSNLIELHTLEYKTWLAGLYILCTTMHLDVLFNWSLWVWIPLRCTSYSIQHYVIKFINDLRQVSGFICQLHRDNSIITNWWSLQILRYSNIIYFQILVLF